LTFLREGIKLPSLTGEGDDVAAIVDAGGNHLGLQALRLDQRVHLAHQLDAGVYGTPINTSSRGSFLAPADLTSHQLSVKQCALLCYPSPGDT